MNFDIEKELLLDDAKLNAKFAQAIIRDIQLKVGNIFIYENLPNTIDKEFIENNLFYFGFVSFSYDKEHGYLVLPCSAWQNMLELNFKPTTAVINGQGYIKTKLIYYGKDTEKRLLYNNKNVYDKQTACVIIKNNCLYYSTFDLLFPDLYTYYLSKRKLPIALHNLQLQNLISCDYEDRANLNALIKDIKDNKFVIGINKKAFKGQPLQPLNLLGANNLMELDTLTKSLYGKILEKIGILSLNYEKRERMISDEVNSNKEQTNINLDYMLKEREKACERINELFDLNIKVRINTDYVEELKVSYQGGNENDVQRMVTK